MVRVGEGSRQSGEVDFGIVGGAVANEIYSCIELIGSVQRREEQPAKQGKEDRPGMPDIANLLSDGEKEPRIFEKFYDSLETRTHTNRIDKGDEGSQKDKGKGQEQRVPRDGCQVPVEELFKQKSPDGKPDTNVGYRGGKTGRKGKADEGNGDDAREERNHLKKS